MFKGLADRLSSVFDKLAGRGLLTESVVNDALREIKIALIEADVALPVVKDFINAVREKAVGELVVKSVKPDQMVVKIVHDELVNLLGTGVDLKQSGTPTVILMLGLQGSGKTTSSAKLGVWLKKQKKTALLASLDIYRPAAQEQLAELGKATEIDTLPIVAGQKPEAIAKRALDAAKTGGYDFLILDTAGRLHIDADMMDEVAKIKNLSHPAETLLVVDALSGQDAVNVAKTFNEQIGITGTILTRIDGDSRGGAALSMRSITGQPIRFLGVGEKTDALELFDAKRIADRILGMGDVVGLVETAMEKVNQDEAKKTAERMMSGQFDLNDLLSQLRQMNKLGDIKGVMKMIPGLSKFQNKIDEAKIDNSVFRRQEAIILSMTPRERKNPDILKAARKIRIANGSGTEVSDVNRLLKQYEQMAHVMKQFKKMGPLGMMSMMKKMGGMMGGKGMPDDMGDIDSLMKSGGNFPPFK